MPTRKIAVTLIALASFVGWAVAGFFVMYWLSGYRAFIPGRLDAGDVVGMSLAGMMVLLVVAILFWMVWVIAEEVFGDRRG